MKTRKLLSGLTICCFAAGLSPAYAVDSLNLLYNPSPNAVSGISPNSYGSQYSPRQRDYLASSSASLAPWQRLAGLQKSSNLIGKRVTDDRGQSFGTIRDVVVDLRTGDAPCALVSSKYDSHGNLYVVPASEFAFVNSGEAVLNCESSILVSGPTISHYEDGSTTIAGAIDKASSFFQMETAAIGDDSNHQLVRCSNLTGLEAQNQQGATVGMLSSILIDLPKGRATYAVFSPDGGNSKSFVAPPQAISVAQNGSMIKLQADDATIASSTISSQDLMAQAINPAWATTVYNDYAINTDGITPTENERVNVRARIDSNTSHRDTSETREKTSPNMTREVLSAMQDLDSGKIMSRSQVLVVFRDGKIVLTGQVRSASDKSQLGATAESIAGEGNVDNQLKVK